MAFKPLHDRVLVRRVESEEKTAGGLIIPDSAKEKPSEGEVVAVGDGARKDNGELIEMAVSVGDRILFGKWSGTEITIDGEELLIMKESDILGVTTDAKAAQAA
ncbi:co-chaperone GroES [Roseovarius sp. SK2]|uniref:co-chaperone GroES n=1 Tax=Roseovarius TaxID=74030 RepID=UPI000CDDD9DD|nr:MULTISPECIES: co-chaperone GroES [Roseovarius]MBY5986394.1 co-chaperone GroES [Roseovarius atlanticus]MBY6125034.1 co-chaperone GroES [Roseovarius atlanticus]MBY6150505.1 co-chaperone GroES [Roseovarius atlanticus]MDD9725765.1 co-chaperone GroES [Roseovarius sp. SK2]QFT79593.1 10 kDa chaperonin 1 [Roseovarius sp. THAF27]